MRMREKQKNAAYIQLAENYVFSVSNLFFLAIPMVTCRKKVQKGRLGQKCGNLHL